MPSTSGKPVASLSTMPMEMVFKIIQKMDGPSLLGMYQTNPWMAAAVERQLRDLDPRHITLGKSLALHLTSDAVIVKYSRYENPTNRATIRSSTKLPIDALESNIWRFLSFEEIHLEDSETATKYLDQIQHEKQGVQLLKATNCDISLVIKALHLFKPRSVEIDSFTGNLHEILENLPIHKWIANDGGQFKFPRGHNFGEVLPQLEDCRYFQLPHQAGSSDRHFLMIFPEKKRFILSMLETSITLVKVPVH